MKRSTIVAVVVVVLAFSGSALAGEMKPAVYVGGGISMPLSPDFFKDYWKMGFGGGGGVGFAFSPVVEVGANFAYSSFALDEDKFLAAAGLTSEIMDLYNISVDISGFDMSAMEFLAYVKYTFNTGESKFKPYLTSTVGMTQLSADEISLEVDVPGHGMISFTQPSQDVTEMTLGFGAGFEYMFGPKAGLWLDGKYMLIMTEGESTAHLPIRAGLKFMFGGN